MDLIRLYCDIKDIKIKNLINHFMRCLGVYVEEIYYKDIQGEHKGPSLFDVYVITSFYEGRSVEIENKDTTIMILDNQYDVDEQSAGIKKILFYKYKTSGEFLKAFAEKIKSFLNVPMKFEKRLLYGNKNFETQINQIAELYVENQIFQSSVYARYFFENEDRFYWGINHYIQYISDLKKLNDGENQSDLLTYTISYAMYEADVFCKKHLYELFYPTDEILYNCSELLKKYESNEEICILIADVHLELLDSWAKAANEFGNINLMYCSYAHYKRGRILRKYADDVDNALVSIKNALKLNRYYYNAWYQYAMCYDEIGDYAQENYALHQISDILQEKGKANMLSPIEMEYLSKSISRIQQINYEKMYDMGYEKTFQEMKEDIQNAQGGSGYIKYMNFVEPEKGIIPDVLVEEFNNKMKMFETEICT